MYYIFIGCSWVRNMYLLHASVLLCLVQSIKTNINISTENDLEYCLNHIGNKILSDETLLMILNFQDINLNIYKQTIQWNDLEELPDFSKSRLRIMDVYMIVLELDQSLKSVLEFLSKTLTWNPRGQFIIYLPDFATDVFYLLRSYFIFNVVVLVKNTTQTINLFTHGSHDKGKLIGSCNLNFFNNSTGLFSNQALKNWTNTELKVGAVVYDPYVTNDGDMCGNDINSYFDLSSSDQDLCGIEIQVLHIAKKFLKFKMEYVNSTYRTWGSRQENGSYNDLFGDIQNNKINVGIGFLRINDPQLRHFDLSYPYIEDSLNWVVPSGDRLNHLNTILFIFDFKIWFLIISLMVIIPLIVYVAANYSTELRYYESLGNCFLICYMTSLNQPSTHHPKKNFLRFIFAIWWILSLIMITAYQSHLATRLNFYHYGKPLRSIEEVLNHRLKLGFHRDYLSLFSNNTKLYKRIIAKKYTDCKTDYACLNKTAFERDFVTLSSIRHASKVSYYLNSDNRFLLHFIEPKVQNLLISVAFKKGHPIFYVFDIMLMRLKESGIIQHKIEIFDYLNKVALSRKSVLDVDSLCFEEMSGVFIILGIGSALACIFLILELIVNRWVRFV